MQLLSFCLGFHMHVAPWPVPSWRYCSHPRSVHEGTGQVNFRVVLMCVCNVLAHVGPMSLCVLMPACVKQLFV